jgi:hypothetical protein
MVIGEFKSEEIGELFKKEHRIRVQYTKFCKEHDRVLKTKYCVSPNSMFVLKIIILKKYDNN